MRMRSHDVPDMSLSIVKISETICCVRKYQGSLIQDKYHASYDFFHECVEKGIALAPKPFFIINIWREKSLLPPVIFMSVYPFCRNKCLRMPFVFRLARPFLCWFTATIVTLMRHIYIWERKYVNAGLLLPDTSGQSLWSLLMWEMKLIQTDIARSWCCRWRNNPQQMAYLKSI